MPKTPENAKAARTQLLQALNDEGRQYSTAVIVFHHAVSRRLGLNAGDHKYADILMREGPMSAGRLSELTGLTSGAITGIVDRLEHAGWVQRSPDPADRRRVIVTPVYNPKKAREAQAIFGSLSTAMGEVSGSYRDAELKLILDFMARTRTILLDQAARFGSVAKAGGRGKTAGNRRKNA